MLLDKMQVLCARQHEALPIPKTRYYTKGSSASDRAAPIAYLLPVCLTTALHLTALTYRAVSAKSAEREEEYWTPVQNVHICQLVLSHL